MDVCFQNFATQDEKFKKLAHIQFDSDAHVVTSWQVSEKCSPVSHGAHVCCTAHSNTKDHFDNDMMVISKSLDAVASHLLAARTQKRESKASSTKCCIPIPWSGPTLALCLPCLPQMRKDASTPWENLWVAPTHWNTFLLGCGQLCFHCPQSSLQCHSQDRHLPHHLWPVELLGGPLGRFLLWNSSNQQPQLNSLEKFCSPNRWIPFQWQRQDLCLQNESWMIGFGHKAMRNQGKHGVPSWNQGRACCHDLWHHCGSVSGRKSAVQWLWCLCGLCECHSSGELGSCGSGQCHLLPAAHALGSLLCQSALCPLRCGRWQQMPQQFTHWVNQNQFPLWQTVQWMERSQATPVATAMTTLCSVEMKTLWFCQWQFWVPSFVLVLWHMTAWLNPKPNDELLLLIHFHQFAPPLFPWNCSCVTWVTLKCIAQPHFCKFTFTGFQESAKSILRLLLCECHLECSFPFVLNELNAILSHIFLQWCHFVSGISLHCEFSHCCSNAAMMSKSAFVLANIVNPKLSVMSVCKGIKTKIEECASHASVSWWCKALATPYSSNNMFLHSNVQPDVVALSVWHEKRSTHTTKTRPARSEGRNTLLLLTCCWIWHTILCYQTHVWIVQWCRILQGRRRKWYEFIHCHKKKTHTQL